jgi:hypothetical protein
MTDILRDYIPEFQAEVRENRAKRNQLLDTITQTLSDKTPRPMEVAHMASESLRPLTTFDIARGITRPSALEALTAARAASAKYDIDLLNVAEKGISGVAEEAQQLANLINAQAQMNNKSSGKIKDVLGSVTDGMSPDSQVMFTTEFLSKLQDFDGEPDTNTLYSLANDVVKKIQPKGKTEYPKFPHHLDDNGNRITYGQLEDGSFGIINVTPPQAAQALSNRLIPVTTKTVDANTGITTERTEYQAVAPGRAGEAPKYLGPVGSDQYDYGNNPGYYADPNTGQPDPNRPMQGARNPLESVKETPPKAMDLKESSDLTSVMDAQKLAAEVKSKIINKDGTVNEKLIAAMWTNWPRSDGKQYREELEQAIFSYIFIKSGQTVTDNEREIWSNLFLPSTLSSPEGNKSKLNRLEQFFNGATEFLPKHLQERLKRKDGLPDPTATMPQTSTSKLDARKQAILNKAKEYKDKVDLNSLKELLKKNDIDPGLL